MESDTYSTIPPAMTLTGHQVWLLNEFMGGDYETQVSLAVFPDRVADNGEAMPAGLYCWCTEYPEEGSVLLEAYDE